MISQSPPPGYATRPWLALDMSRQNFYQSGLNTLWEGSQFTAYQIGGATGAILYSQSDINILRHWLHERKGLVALGLLPSNAPLKPDFDLIYWFDDSYRDIECPGCGGPGVADWDSGRMWCPECGVRLVRG